jgi:hypothetical protein
MPQQPSPVVAKLMGLRGRGGTTELSPLPQTELEKRQAEETLLSFLSVQDIGQAARVSNWTVAEEVRILAEIARGDHPKASPADMIRASARLRQIFTGVLKAAGMVEDERQQINLDADGNVTGGIAVRHATRLVHAARSATERALMGESVPGLSVEAADAADATTPPPGEDE